eukprot:GILI01031590.1.p1 GENE.GILI01031590.1~~GILI01031590.1.p1  ORF type:complete len:289 (+),score=35.84 GILI01031590.1:62-928(+)
MPPSLNTFNGGVDGNTTTPAAVLNTYEQFITNHIFANPDHLTTHDYVALGYCTAALVGYWIFFRVKFVSDPHGDFIPSHFEFQRVAWSQYIWGDVSLKILTIQNVRSALMVLAAFVQTAVAASVALGGSFLGSWVGWVHIRTLIPLCLLLYSICHLAIATWAFVAVLFTATCESMDDASRDRIRDEEGIEYDSKRGFATSTLLTVQSAGHFRVGWRLMLVGLVGVFWSQSPVFMIALMTVLVAALYANDFGMMSLLNHEELKAMPDVQMDADTKGKMQWQTRVFGAGT